MWRYHVGIASVVGGVWGTVKGARDGVGPSGGGTFGFLIREIPVQLLSRDCSKYFRSNISTRMPGSIGNKRFASLAHPKDIS
jgi:hypothetical protein